MRRLASCLVATVVLSTQPASAEVDWCQNWNGLSTSLKQALIRDQAKMLLTQDPRFPWEKVRPAFEGDLSELSAGIDGACAGSGAWNFDAGRMMGAAIGIVLVGFFVQHPLGPNEHY